MIDLDHIKSNPIDEQTKCFQQLTKIAGKPEINDDKKFEAFKSPFIKINLNNYKRKFRKELILQHGLVVDEDELSSDSRDSS